MANPRLRFRQADSSEYPDWERKRFSDLYKTVSEKNDGTFATDKIISVANMYFKPDAKIVKEDYLKTYNICRLGDIAFEGNRSKSFAFGRFVENTIGDGIVSHVFSVFRPIEPNHNLGFWKYYIHHEPVMKDVLRRCTKKTTMMTNLIAKDFLKQTIAIPCLEEQAKIAAFLSAVDDVITTTSKELEDLELLKRGAMQRIFSRKVRFCRDDGSAYPEWQSLEMNQIFTEIIDKSHPDLPVLSILQGEGTVLRDQSNRRIQYNRKSLSGYKAMKPGDFIIHLRSFEGGLECANQEGISSPAYKILRSTTINTDIYRYYLRSHDFIRNKLSVAVVGIRDGKNIDMDTFWHIAIAIPCLEEQAKIAEFLAAMDTAIAKAKEELDLWRLLKRGLTQQMFA